MIPSDDAARSLHTPSGDDPGGTTESDRLRGSDTAEDDEKQLSELTAETLRLEAAVSMEEAAVLLTESNMSALGGRLAAANARAVELGVARPKLLGPTDPEGAEVTGPSGDGHEGHPSRSELHLTKEVEAGLRVLETVGRSLTQSTTTEAQEAKERPRYMSVKLYAEYLGVSDSTVRRWLDLGLPHRTLGPHLRRIEVEKADEWLDNGGPKKAIKRSATIRSRTKGRG